MTADVRWELRQVPNICLVQAYSNQQNRNFSLFLKIFSYKSAHPTEVTNVVTVQIFNGVVESLFNITVYLRIKNCSGMNI